MHVRASSLSMFNTVDKAVLYRIFDSWLGVRDVARLDSAVCHEKSRPTFLAIAYGELTMYKFDSEDETEWNQFNTWSLAKRLLVGNLTITGHLVRNEGLRTEFLAQCAHQATHVSWRSELNEEITTVSVGKALSDIVGCCPHVTSIDFSHFERQRESKPISLQPLIQSSLQLTELNLSHTRISDHELLPVLPHLSKLKVLNLNWCKRLTEHVVSLIGRHCPRLEILAMADVCQSDASLHAIVKHCPHLRSVDLLCTKVTDTGVQDLIKHCPQLEYCYVASTQVTNCGYLELASRCLLTEINMNREYNITEATLIEMVLLCPTLKVLTAASFRSLTDDVLVSIAATCPHFTSLHVNGCTLITDEGIAALALGCRQMRSLHLDYCRRVTDVGLASLALHCPGLVEISIRYLRFVTDVTLRALAKHCRRLERLTCVMCTKITAAGILHLLQKCRRLHYLDCSTYSNYVAEGISEAITALRPRRINMPEFSSHAEQMEEDAIDWERKQGIEDDSQTWA